MVILGQAKMRVVLGKDAWTYKAPTHQSNYDAAAAHTNAGPLTQLKSQHKAKNYNYEVYVGIDTGAIDLILFAVGDEALSPLRKQYIDFTGGNSHSIMKHLRKNVCLKLRIA